ncbi:hypothetical protein BGZ70_000665 [Mortierella alpina]|uniref:Uncharacterized protein n=1 Tax=Mortierella alpina TaxID=64518 RepID=A0A9P6J0M0_MORAP|nr:hypothetical protein BGZ70_000665 [Mortierella alpina]
MRPDPHKQAASRRYHSKVKSRGGSTAGAAADSSLPSAHSGGARGGGRGGGRGRGGRGGRGGYQGSRAGHDDKDDRSGEEGEEGDDYAPRKSYARRKITSNADRYTERDEEVTEAEELDQGIDRQTIAFREMLKDSDQRKTFDPAAYFRFKSEKEVESQDAMEDSQQARKLLEVRLDDIETALMTLSLKDRLYLRDSDVRALDRDMIGKVSLTTGKPIVPKLVRGQAASDILIRPSTSVSGGTASSAAVATSYSKAASGSVEPDMRASMDADLDELLDITKSYGRGRLPTPAAAGGPSSSSGKISAPAALSETPSAGTKTRLPPPLSKGSKTSDAKTPPAAPGKGLPPLRKAPPARPEGKKDEEWLDSVLGM